MPRAIVLDLLNQSYSFSKKSRFSGRNGFNKVFSEGVRWHSNFASFYAKKSSEQRNARLGVSVAKKRIPKAVSRNGIKRILKESFRHNQGTLYGLEVVVVVKKNLERDPSMVKALDKAWEIVAKKACHL